MRFTKPIRKIKQLIDWAPVIWKDEDWDYGYILKLLDYKLKRMRPVIENGYACEAQKVAQAIEEARLLIANIQGDPHDEWEAHCISNHITNRCADKSECRRVLKATIRREKENWHKLWQHFDDHMRSWWD